MIRILVIMLAVIICVWASVRWPVDFRMDRDGNPWWAERRLGDRCDRTAPPAPPANSLPAARTRQNGVTSKQGSRRSTGLLGTSADVSPGREGKGRSE